MATVYQVLMPQDAIPPASAYARQSPRTGSVSTLAGLRFTLSDVAYFVFEAINYGSGNLTVDVDWYSAGGNTTGKVKWQCAIACVTPGDATAIGSRSFATATNAETDVNSTAYGIVRTSVTVSNLDSIAARDNVTLQLKRIASTSELTGSATAVMVTVSYSDT
jgi:hypothetical protein